MKPGEKASGVNQRITNFRRLADANKRMEENSQIPAYRQAGASPFAIR